MQIKIGEKIRELRHRDGRTQDDLATALGVTCQAVSRWEANGGYPDMEIMPAIANYFHVTIDELFGYSKDREEKLKTILEKAEKAIGEKGDMTECVNILRAAAEEFPNEPQVLIKLGTALNMHGWKKYGARSYTTDGSDYSHEDIEYNSKNKFWQEEVKVFENVLTMDLPPEDRDTVVMNLVKVYAKMGCNEKAVELSRKQNSIIMSRELLLPKATAAEAQDQYLGEAIIALLTELKNVFWYSVCTKISLFTTEIGTRLLIDLAHLFESVFSDGRCGSAHMQLSDLYLTAALHTARYADRRKEDLDQAFEYFTKGFEHKKTYESIRNQGEYQYTAPLVSKVTFPSANFPSLANTFWKSWIEIFPDALQKRIQADPQFAECFE